jgi:hypothetical protein
LAKPYPDKEKEERARRQAIRIGHTLLPKKPTNQLYSEYPDTAVSVPRHMLYLSDALAGAATEALAAAVPVADGSDSDSNSDLVD